MNLAEHRQSIGYWDAVVASGPKLLDDYPESADDSVVHRLPCSEYQFKTHMDGQSPKEGCGYLDANSINKVKGIHWGTWSWFATGSGQDKNADTQMLFQKMHR